MILLLFLLACGKSNRDKVEISSLPDSEPIAFISNRDGNTEIYTIESDGSSLLNLTNNEATDYAAQWSPGGQSILFYSNREGNNEIYAMHADGSNVR